MKFTSLVPRITSLCVTLKLDFENTTISGLVLAKVGNPSRNESLQTSKQLFKVEEEDQPTGAEVPSPQLASEA
ncbi:enolase [Akkermansiaceae bacterium]|nr:enolase [Akkermansiaceae bacterium]